MLGLAMGVTGAVSIVIAQYFGAKSDEMVRKAMVNAHYLPNICCSRCFRNGFLVSDS